MTPSHAEPPHSAPGPKAGVIGLGVGEQHAKAFSRLGTLKAVYDLNPEKSSACAKSLKVEANSSYEQLLSDPDIGIVSIASYDQDHYAQIIAALNAKKHIFVEKPLCCSIEELYQINKVWQENGQVSYIMSNLVLRAAPIYIWLKQAVADERFGQIYAIDGDYLYGRMHKITSEWRKDVEDYSVMAGGGIHMIDLMLWIAGQLPESVDGVGNKIATANTAFRYDDFMAATFRFPSGLIGRITANFGCMHRHQHVLRVFGTKGTFILDDLGPRVHWQRSEDWQPEMLSIPPLPDHKGVLIPEFVEHIESEQSPKPMTQREFDLVSVMVASDLAHKHRSAVKPEYVGEVQTC